jgi:hypothetical protein
MRFFSKLPLSGLLLAGLLGLALLLVPARAEKEKTADTTKKDEGFVSIFDGKTLNGWKVSAKTGHSRASKNTSGGKWEVVDGAITGTQDIKGNGGIWRLRSGAGDEQRLRPG